MIMNRSPYPLETFVKLRGSPDYKFIHVEEYGYVVSYSPRLSSGDHHHLIWVRGEDEVENETEGFQCQGHSNCTICTFLGPFCSEIFPTFSLS